MKRVLEAAAVAGCLAIPSTGAPAMATSAQLAAPYPPPLRSVDFGGPRNDRRIGYRHFRLPYEPRYYARPYYYRPYPYTVSYPFVFGPGPWWW
jgi:hypothetical protein